MSLNLKARNHGNKESSNNYKLKDENKIIIDNRFIDEYDFLCKKDMELYRYIDYLYTNIKKYDVLNNKIIESRYPIKMKKTYEYNYRRWYYYYYSCYYYSYMYYRSYYIYYNNYKKRYYEYYIKERRCEIIDLGTEYLDTINIKIDSSMDNNDKIEGM